MTKENPESKKNRSVARVTTFLTGSVKSKFFEEVERTGIKECHLAREILTKHYALIKK